MFGGPLQKAAATGKNCSRLLSAEDAGDSGKVVGDPDVGPIRRVEERFDGREAVVAEFEDEEAAGLEESRDLGHQGAVEFVALFAAVKRDGGFVFAHFDRERVGFPAGDVRRIGDDEIKKRSLVTSDW